MWGPDAQPESSKRLGWLDLASESRALVEPLAKLREELVAEGLDHIVLAGMGGSSLAPEVITETVGKSLVTLDTTDAGQVRAALAENLDRTILVVSSKSGGTVETDSHRRAYVKAFVDAGLSEADANKRLVVVTDPGSPLEKSAKEAGVRAVFLANPNVGGRYSALTPLSAWCPARWPASTFPSCWTRPKPYAARWLIQTARRSRSVLPLAPRTKPVATRS
ncbi:hypothetical protein [Fodinicola feengrottensis]|uniref:hypothetical protein n=1 Tax=Fodinicola feengrottensis TaxID=435914 RepID=UPI0024429A6C|nr:hypothetical protein [Fodinicola feengrottensis]